MKSFYFLLLVCATFCEARLLNWDLNRNFPAEPGDTVLVTGTKIQISSEIRIPNSSYLFIKATDGVEFIPGAQILSSAPRQSIKIWTDWDANGAGHFQCASQPCLRLSGDSSVLSLIEPISAAQDLLISNPIQFSAYGTTTGTDSHTERLLQVNSWKDLQNFSDLSKKTPAQIIAWGVALGKDLHATSDWTPLMGSEGAFSGIVDGQGHTISSLKIDARQYDDIGFIGRGRNATIRNLGIDSARVIGMSRVGILAGQLASSSVSSSYTSGTISGENAVGGMIGLAFNSKIQDGYTQTMVHGNKHVGGIIGLLSGRSLLKNMWSTSRVSGKENEGATIGSTWQGSTSHAVYWLQDIGIASGTCSESSCDERAMSLTAMQLRTNYEGFDFTNIWNIIELEDFPRLKGFSETSSSGENVSHPRKQSATSPFYFGIDGTTDSECPGNIPCHSSKELQP